MFGFDEKISPAPSNITRASICASGNFVFSSFKAGVNINASPIPERAKIKIFISEIYKKISPASAGLFKEEYYLVKKINL